MTKPRSSKRAQRRLSALASLSAACGLFSNTLPAQSVIKSSTTDALDQAASWVGGAAPGAANTASWDAASAVGAIEFGASASWGGLDVSAATGAVTINATTPATLSLGAGGLTAGATTALTLETGLGIVLTSDQTWALGNGTAAANVLVKGVISGSGKLTASRGSTGANTLTLNGANTFTGGFTLEPNASVTLGSVPTVTSGNTVSSPLGSYTGTQTLTINGGRLNSAALATFHAKNVTVNGDFTFSNTARTAFGGAFDMAGGTRTVTLTRSTTNANAPVAGGNSTLNLSATTGAPFTVANGTLRLVADAAVPATNIVVVVPQANTAFTGNSGLTLGDKVMYGPAGTGGLNVAASVPSVTLESGALWNLADATTFTVAARNPQVNSLAGAGSVINTFNGTAGQLGQLATLTVRGNKDVGATNFSGVIYDNGGTVFPTRTLGITAVSKQGATTQIFSGPNTYSGGTTVTGGALNVTGAGTLGTGAITVNGGSIDLGGTSLTNTSLTLTNGTVSNGSLALSGSISAAKGTLSANLSGAAGLTKTTVDTVTLSGANTYSGATAVTAGVLAVPGSLTSAVTVSSGATLSGEGSTTGSLTFSAGNSTYQFDPSTPGAFTAASIDATGATVSVVPTTITGGTDIPVLVTSSGITGGIGAFSLGTRGSLSFSGDGKQLLATIPTPGSITASWVGGDATNPSFWDTNTTTNFSVSSAGATFYAGDNARFDDTATSYAVAIQSPGVSTTQVTFDNSVNDYTVSGSAISAGALTKQGTAKVTLTNTNTYSGATVIDAGTLQLGSGGTTGALSPSSAITNNGVLRINRSNTVTQGTDFAPVVAGTGALYKEGTGNLILNGANTFSGAITVAGGTITAAHASALGTSAGGVVVSSPSVLALKDNVTITGETVTLSGTGGASGSSRGTLRTETGDNTWAGPVIINSLYNVGGSPGETRLGVSTSGSLTVSGEISGGSALPMTGPSGFGATVAVRSVNRAATVILSGANTFLGNFAIYSGSVKLAGGNNRLPTTARLLLAFSGTDPLLDLNGCNQEVAGLSDFDIGSGISSEITNTAVNPTTLTVNTADVGTIFSGTITGNLAFTKSGTGTLSLTGANTYTGDTTISDGELSLAQAVLADGSTVHIGATGKLNLNAATTDTVNALYINGVQALAGVYGSTASGAANADDTHFGGTGTLTVLTGAPIDPYVTWSGGFGLSGGNALETADVEADGLNNLLEWVLGGSPVLSDAHLISPRVTKNATHYLLTFKRADDSEASATLVAQWSTDLSTWNNVTIGTASTAADAFGVTVTVTENGASADDITVSIPVANASAGRLFGRVVATR